MQLAFTKKLGAIFVLMFAILAVSLPTSAMAASVPKVPTMEQPVTDETGTLTKVDLDNISQKAANDPNTRLGEIAVYVTNTVPSGKTLEIAANDVARAWGVGSKKNDGVLLYIAKDDRVLRWEIAQGASEYFTDADSKRVMNGITEYFKADDYAGGIAFGVEGARSYLDGISAAERQKEYDDAIAMQQEEMARIGKVVGIIVLTGTGLGLGALVFVIIRVKIKDKKKRELEIAQEKARIELIAKHNEWLRSPAGIAHTKAVEKREKERQKREKERRVAERLALRKREAWLLTAEGQAWQKAEDKKALETQRRMLERRERDRQEARRRTQREDEERRNRYSNKRRNRYSNKRRNRYSNNNNHFGGFGGGGFGGGSSGSGFGGGGGFSGGGSSGSW